MNKEYTQAHTKKEHMSEKMNARYTMSAVKPTDRTHGERYAMNANLSRKVPHTMNATKPGERSGERPTQHGGTIQRSTMDAVTPRYKGGEKALQSNPHKNFAAAYSQHGR